MNYAIPILTLIATIAAFFALARGAYASFGTIQFILRILVALPLLASGIWLHFFRTGTVAAIIPPVFPFPTFLAVLTGICEISGAIGLFVARVRQAAALCIAIMMVAVIPANVYVAGQLIDGTLMPGIAPRTLLQIIYIVLVLMAGYGIPVLRHHAESPS